MLSDCRRALSPAWKKNAFGFFLFVFDSCVPSACFLGRVMVSEVTGVRRRCTKYGSVSYLAPRAYSGDSSSCTSNAVWMPCCVVSMISGASSYGNWCASRYSITCSKCWRAFSDSKRSVGVMYSATPVCSLLCRSGCASRILPSLSSF